jgi:hypothetical protein
MQALAEKNPAHWSQAPIRTLVLAALAAITITGGVWMLQYAASLASLERAAAVEAAQTSFEISAQTQSWLYLSTGIMLAGLGLLIFVIVIEHRRKRREGWRAERGLVPGPRERWPIVGDIAWISLDPRAAKRFHLARVLSFVLLFIYLVANFAIVSSLDLSLLPSKLVAYTALVFAVPMIVLCLVMAHAMKRNAARRIGVQQNGVLFDRGAGTPERLRLSEVRVSSVHLLLGKRIVNVIDQWGRPIFPKQELDGYLLSRVSAEAFVSVPRLLWLALRRGSPAVWSGVLLIAFMLAVTLVDQLYPGVLGRLFVQWVKTS